MLAEDLRSRKFEAFESYMESKGKRKKPKGKKGKAKGKKWASFNLKFNQNGPNYLLFHTIGSWCRETICVASELVLAMS